MFSHTNMEAALVNTISRVSERRELQKTLSKMILRANLNSIDEGMIKSDLRFS